MWDKHLEISISKTPSKNNDWNVYFQHSFNIDINWKKDANEKKNFTVVVELYQNYKESHWIGSDTNELKWVDYRNFATHPTKDLINYNPKLLEIKDLDNKDSISSRFMVSEELMDHYISRIEIEKTNMIQYIGDICYTHKENDPCGYSKITIKDEDEKERDALVIFNEDDDPNMYVFKQIWTI